MIVLASASPRRRVLLEAAGLDFRVEPTHVDEEADPGLGPEALARMLAERKARAAASAQDGPAVWVVGADTVVAVPGPATPGGGTTWTVYGKPADEAEAARMLSALGGTRHRVVTGVCVVRTSDGVERSRAETTWVTMRPLSTEEVRAYVASGEWRDKAGGYAIQETADRFVTALEGAGFDNVVGLPVEATLALLRRLGAPIGPPAGGGPPPPAPRDEGDALARDPGPG